MKPKSLRQIFDELAEFVSPQYRASFERLGRRLELLHPDDEILMLLWYVAIQKDIADNERKALTTRLSDVEKWMKILFWVFIGQSIVLGMFVCLFEAAMAQLNHS